MLSFGYNRPGGSFGSSVRRLAHLWAKDRGKEVLAQLDHCWGGVHKG